MVNTQLYVALDVPEGERALDLAQRLAPLGVGGKVGLELFVREGPSLVARMAEMLPVFLDLKLHDIPRTVEAAVRGVCPLGVRLLTVHASGGMRMLQAAQEAAAGRLDLLGVTVLTSLDEEECRRSYGRPPGETVMELATVSAEAGIRGIVTSPREVSRLREAFPQLLRVVPGIRPTGSAAGDQRRIAGPQEALRAGADILVVGRPIVEAADPVMAARTILAEMEALG